MHPASITGQTWNTSAYAAHGRFVATLATAVVDLLAPVPGEHILDVGCGDGALTEHLAASGAILTGIDASLAMVESPPSEPRYPPPSHTSASTPKPRQHPSSLWLPSTAACFSRPASTSSLSTSTRAPPHSPAALRAWKFGSTPFATAFSIGSIPAIGPKPWPEPSTSFVPSCPIQPGTGQLTTCASVSTPRVPAEPQPHLSTKLHADNRRHLNWASADRVGSIPPLPHRVFRRASEHVMPRDNP